MVTRSFKQLVLVVLLFCVPIISIAQSQTAQMGTLDKPAQIPLLAQIQTKIVQIAARIRCHWSYEKTVVSATTLAAALALWYVKSPKNSPVADPTKQRTKDKTTPMAGQRSPGTSSQNDSGTAGQDLADQTQPPTFDRTRMWQGYLAAKGQSKPEQDSWIAQIQDEEARIHFSAALSCTNPLLQAQKEATLFPVIRSDQAAKNLKPLFAQLPTAAQTLYLAQYPSLGNVSKAALLKNTPLDTKTKQERSAEELADQFIEAFSVGGELEAQQADIFPALPVLIKDLILNRVENSQQKTQLTMYELSAFKASKLTVESLSQEAKIKHITTTYVNLSVTPFTINNTIPLPDELLALVADRIAEEFHEKFPSSDTTSPLGSHSTSFAQLPEIIQLAILLKYTEGQRESLISSITDEATQENLRQQSQSAAKWVQAKGWQLLTTAVTTAAKFIGLSTT